MTHRTTMPTPQRQRHPALHWCQVSLFLSFPGQCLGGAGREAAQCWCCLWVQRAQEASDVCRWAGKGAALLGGCLGRGGQCQGRSGAPTLARLAVKSTHSKSSPMRCRNSSTCGRLSTYTCGHRQRAACCWDRLRLTQHPMSSPGDTCVPTPSQRAAPWLHLVGAA